MLPPELALEWQLWILLNGIPAIVASTLFFIYPPWDHKFGWNVIPRASGILLGVGFLMRWVMYVQQFTAGSYQEMRWLHLGNIVFAGVLLGTTAVWGDTFHWRRFTAIMWLFLYIEEPVWMLTLLPRSAEAIASQPPLPGGPINPLLQGGLFLEAAILLVFGLALMVYPRFRNLVSWKPDHTSAKILAGWPLSYAVWAPTLALLPSWGEARGGVMVNIVWLAGTVIAMLIFRRHFDLSHRATKIMLGVSGGLAVLLIVGVVVQG